jgi:hypothetical protein
MKSYEDLKAKFLDTLPRHIGHAGLLCQLDRDQGDGLQRQNTLHNLVALIDDQSLMADILARCPGLTYGEPAHQALETRSGWYRRSCDPNSGWQFDDRQTSRDQLSVLKLALAVTGSKDRLIRTLIAQLKRLVIFHQNYWSGTNYQPPDILLPNEIGTFARGLMGWGSLIITNFTDATLGANILLRNVGELNIWSEDNMLAQNLLVAAHIFPSISGKILMFFYKKTNFMARLWAYHKDSDTNNGCECLYWLYRMAFLKLEGYDPGDSVP